MKGNNQRSLSVEGQLLSDKDHFSYIFGRNPEKIDIISEGGSARRYYRLAAYGSEGDISAIWTSGDNVEENQAFVALARYLAQKGFKVPVILSVSEDGCGYLQQDLGDLSLLDIIYKGEFHDIVAKFVRELARLHSLHDEEWEKYVISEHFGKRMIVGDLNYFKYEMLKPLDIVYDEKGLEDDFDNFVSDLLGIVPLQNGFMMRDCQSRNVMIHEGEPYFIDFQGGRRGPGLYDIVSLLWQSKADFDSDFRKEMLDVYFREWEKLSDNSSAELKRYVDKFVLLRTLQVLGAYGLRGIVQRKSHFLQSIPNALCNLQDLINRGVLNGYPYLQSACQNLCRCPKVAYKNEKSGGMLTLEVFSFSYRKGYPLDFSGNGGGFMFDCRGLHNPGRYEQYIQLTGLDKDVIDFLEERGEVQGFVDTAFSLVSNSIQTYIRRSFSNLQVGFGCTGGQHRSVYCAERLAKLAKKVYPDIRIKINHIEQGIIRSI